jgi:hypothetical protein
MPFHGAPLVGYPLPAHTARRTLVRPSTTRTIVTALVAVGTAGVWGILALLVGGS